MRPWRIQSRNCSAVTGPYSLPSAPMILYMVKGRLLIYRAEVSVTGMPPDGKRGNDLGKR
jgi:hypothetical protein